MNHRMICTIVVAALGGMSACGDDGVAGDGSTTSAETEGFTGTLGTTSSSSSSSSSSDGTSSEGGSESSEAGGSVSTGSLGDGSSSESNGSGTTDTSGDTSGDTGTAACDCEANEYCDWPDDACGDRAPGTCEARPMACDGIYDPVCGCDGQTYSSDCEAATMGVDVDYPGECAAAACGCAAGQWCPLPVGVCNSDEGMCEDIPNDACAEIYAPVCGCDGQTYGNACTAGNAGMNIAYEGECMD